MVPDLCFLGGDAGQLESALAQPFQTGGGICLHATVPHKAAALLRSMIKNHPFVDGNKRMALATTTMFLFVNGWWPLWTKDDAVQECLRIASAHGNVELEPVMSWIQDNSVDLNSEVGHELMQTDPASYWERMIKAIRNLRSQ